MIKKLEEIAKRNLRVETLEVRNSDGLDFYDCSIWGIRGALADAYNAGYQSAIADAKKVLDECRN